MLSSVLYITAHELLGCECFGNLGSALAAFHHFSCITPSFQSWENTFQPPVHFPDVVLEFACGCVQACMAC